jgi:predicted molibdopterin-dependent oxidoreductase YjgC
MWAQKGRQNLKEVDTVCSYCGCGCNLTLHVRKNKIMRISSKKDTINEGWLCVKGRFGFEFVHSSKRLTKPLIRVVDKNHSPLGPEPSISKLFKEVSWEEALDYVSRRLKDIKESHGPDSIAGLSSARCTNEENYLFQKFMRAAIGTNNVDHCARV